VPPLDDGDRVPDDGVEQAGHGFTPVRRAREDADRTARGTRSCHLAAGVTLDRRS
jgi:hypothetical protein